jgi:hypothetical protein
VRLPATTRAERGSVCWRRTYRSRFVHLDTTVLPRQNSQWSLRFAPAEERDPAAKERDHEPPMATAAEATDMLRVGHSGVYRLIAASQRKSINIGRPQRASVASIRHVGATARLSPHLRAWQSHRQATHECTPGQRRNTPARS